MLMMALSPASTLTVAYSGNAQLCMEPAPRWAYPGWNQRRHAGSRRWLPWCCPPAGTTPPVRHAVHLDSCGSPVPAAQPLPLLWVNRQRGGFAGRQVEKRPVVVDRAVPEQPAQQGQRLGGQRLVHKRLQPGERLQGATARIARLLFGEVDHFRVQLGDGAQAFRRGFVAAVQRLAQNELAGVGIVADIEPQPDKAVLAGDQVVNQLAGI